MSYWSYTNDNISLFSSNSIFSQFAGVVTLSIQPSFTLIIIRESVHENVKTPTTCHGRAT
jgi:hypothetical protein